jgi:hypothetical protein
MSLSWSSSVTSPVAIRRMPRVEHLAAVQLEALLEELLGIVAGAVVAHQRDHRLDAVLRRPVAHRDRDLRQREARTHDVGRGLGDAGGGRGHHELGRLRLRGDRCRRQRGRRDAEAGEHVHLVVDHEFLREPLGDVGRGGVVLDDDLDLLAGHRVAVLRHVQPHRGLDLPAGGSLLPGHRQDQADLEGVALGVGQRQRQREGGQARSLEQVATLHGISLVNAEQAVL